MTHNGTCHCGAITIALISDKAISELPVRACECGYCRPQRLRYTSDPAGSVTISGSDLACYRFGTKTADFMRCARCGVLIGAKCDLDGASRMVISAALFDGLSDRDSAAADFDGEQVEGRLARRSRTWTPATIAAQTHSQ